MPGVKIRTSTLSGPKNAVGAPTSRAFIGGITERGTLTPKSVRSLVEYSTEFGTNQTWATNMYLAAQAFFEEGGSELVVARAVGTTPTLATVTVNDRAGTPLATMRVDAANAGAWAAGASGGLSVVITAGAVANSVNVAVYLGVDRVSYVTNKTTVADIVAAFSADVYVRVVDLGSATTYPNRLPALTAGTNLVGGNDDRGTVTIAKVVTALNGAGLAYGAGAVATPGYNATAAGALLIAHGKAYRRIAILAGDVGSLTTDLATMSGSLTTDGEYAGVFGPWVNVPVGSAVQSVSPEGFVLGARARAMNTEGFWKPAAGGRSAAKFVRSAVLPYDASVVDTLADQKVNAITSIGGQVLLYGWRSCSANVEQYSMLHARDVLNTLTEMVETALQPYVFETIDSSGQLLARVKGALVGILQPIEDAGGIATKLDPITGDELNPAYRVAVSQDSENTLTCTVTIRLAGVAETISVSIVKAAFTASI